MSIETAEAYPPLAHPVNHFAGVNKMVSRISPGKTRVKKLFRENPAELWPMGLSVGDTLVTMMEDENDNTNPERQK